MTHILVLGLTLFSFGLSPAAQNAQKATAAKNLATERVTLQFKDTPASQVFRALAKSLGYEVSFDGRLRANVTLQVVNVTAQTALNAICESIGCKWQQSGNRLVVSTPTETTMIWGLNAVGEQIKRSGTDPLYYVVRGLDERVPFDITWAHTEVGHAFFFLGRMMDAQEQDVPLSLRRRKIAVTIQNATMRQALDAVCAVAGCRWELVEQPKRILRATDTDESERIFDVNEPGLTKPQPVFQAKPDYTAASISAKIKGAVKLSCVVETDGTVSDVAVIQSLNYDLDQQAMKAAYRWKFTPGMKDGRPVRVHVEIEISFTVVG